MSQLTESVACGIFSHSHLIMRFWTLWIFTLCLYHSVAGMHQINSTVGGSINIPCQGKFSTPSINLSNLRVHWQDHQKRVLYYFQEGEEDLKVQHDFYKQRISVLKDNLPSGNLSIKMDQLTLKDNSNTVCIYYAEKTEEWFPEEMKKCECNNTIFVAEPYKDLKISINLTTMMATCTTHGGFPSPEITWTSPDISQTDNQTLDPTKVQTNVILNDQTGTYNVTTVVTVEENQSVACVVTNPTSKKMINISTSTRSNKGHETSNIGVTGGWIGVGIAALIVGVIAAIVVLVARQEGRMCFANSADTSNEVSRSGGQGNSPLQSGNTEMTLLNGGGAANDTSD